MKAILLSGAASGIGLASTLHLAQAGWRVYAADRPDSNFTPLADHPNIVALPVDITDDDVVRRTSRAIKADGIALNGLVHNAGLQIAGPLENLPLGDLERMIAVNVVGHLRMTQALRPRLAPASRIIFVSSLMGRVAMPLLGGYSLTKHAVEGMADALRLELAPQGLFVSVIQPGAIATPMTERMGDLLDQAQARLPEALQPHYEKLFAGMRATLDRQNQRATSPSAVVALIEEALTSPHPRPRYTVGTAGLLLMRRLAPDAIADRILRRVLGI